MNVWITDNLCITERWGGGWLIKYSGDTPTLPELYTIKGIGVGLDYNACPPMYTVLVYRKDDRRMKRRELENILTGEVK